jgi:hypothetical protein
MQLQGKLMAGLHIEELAGVVLGLGPPELVPPGLLDALWLFS